MRDAGVGTTLKHFPGLGHVHGNTDFTAQGIVDTVTTAGGPDVATFNAGMHAGAGAVMVSLATYSQIDAAGPAAFSPTVITTLLRGSLGFIGVVVSDDLSSAAAVESVPFADRALRFLGAGGDLVLVDHPETIVPMLSAVRATMAADAGFRARIVDAARHVLRLKHALGLIAGC